MKLSFKLEDIAAVLLVTFASILVYVGMTYRLQVKYHSGRRPSASGILDLPMVSPSKGSSKVGRPRGARATGGQTFKIGIIDTGYDKSIDDRHVKICDDGHYDFGNDTPTIGHTMFHGTAVAQTIASQLEDVDYCLVIYQVAGPIGIPAENLSLALKKAAAGGLAAVNISLEGRQYSFLERQELFNLTSKGTAVFVAAGNRGQDLGRACMSYPACYGLPNLYVVGATQDNGEYVANYSNYGVRVHVWEDGDIDFNGETVRGTSFASPKALGDYVSSLSRLAK